MGCRGTAQPRAGKNTLRLANVRGRLTQERVRCSKPNLPKKAAAFLGQ